MKKILVYLLLGILITTGCSGCVSKKYNDVKESSNVPGEKYVVSTTNMIMGITIPKTVKFRNTPEKAMEDWEELIGKNGATLPFYIKLELNDNKEITASYLEFVINDELKEQWKKDSCSKDMECEAKYDNLVNGIYTLKGGDSGESYDANIEVIKSAFNFEIQQDICHDGGPEFYCDVNNLYVHARGYGDVSVRSGNNRCRISSDGISYCE